MLCLIRVGVDGMLATNHFNVRVPGAAADHVPNPGVKRAVGRDSHVLNRAVLNCVHVDADGAGVPVAKMHVDPAEDQVVRGRTILRSIRLHPLEFEYRARGRLVLKALRAIG